MGLRSAAMACQRSTSAVAWIASQHGRLVFNYLDDFIGVSPALTAHTDFQTLRDSLSTLGLQESFEKSCPPSSVMTCLGVELNATTFTLSVSPERLCEIELLLEHWFRKRTATKTALQSLVGVCMLMKFRYLMTCSNLIAFFDPAFFRFRFSRVTEASSGTQTFSTVRVQLWDVQ